MGRVAASLQRRAPIALKERRSYTSAMQSTSDEELAQRLQQGSEEALSALMERYTQKLLRYGRRFLASEDAIGDIVQDVFIAVYENIQSFDPSRRFSPWIYRMAHNAFVDALRKRGRELSYDALELDRLLPHAAYEDPDLREKEAAEMTVLLEQKLDELPPSYREMIDLYYFEEFSYADIADILHIPIGTVAIRLSRARHKLKSLFKEHV